MKRFNFICMLIALVTIITACDNDDPTPKISVKNISTIHTDAQLYFSTTSEVTIPDDSHNITSMGVCYVINSTTEPTIADNVALGDKLDSNNQFTALIGDYPLNCTL